MKNKGYIFMNQALKYIILSVFCMSTPLFAVRLRENQYKEGEQYKLPKKHSSESSTKKTSFEEPFKHRLLTPENSSKRSVISKRQRYHLPKENHERKVSKKPFKESVFKNRVLSPEYGKDPSDNSRRLGLRKNFTNSSKQQSSYQANRKKDRFPQKKRMQKNPKIERKKYKNSSSPSLFGTPKASKKSHANPGYSKSLFNKPKSSAPTPKSKKNKVKKRNRIKAWRLP